MNAEDQGGCRIGIVSDTHNFLAPRVSELLKGVCHILHAGDVGQPGILRALEEVAPVTAVAGNTDDPGFGYSLTEHFTLGDFSFLVHHIVNPHSLMPGMAASIRRLRPRVVVFGHTHKSFCKEIDGVLFFNPGYAGKPRFAMPRSIAILHCSGNVIRPEFFSLE